MTVIIRQLRNDLLFSLNKHTAPSAPPQFLSGFTLSSTDIKFTWSPPPLIDINGIVQYYVVKNTEQETGRFWTYYAVDEEATVHFLHPYYHYDARVSAHTIETGPFTDAVTVQTEEDG